MFPFLNNKYDFFVLILFLFPEDSHFPILHAETIPWLVRMDVWILSPWLLKFPSQLWSSLEYLYTCTNMHHPHFVHPLKYLIYDSHRYILLFGSYTNRVCELIHKQPTNKPCTLVNLFTETCYHVSSLEIDFENGIPKINDWLEKKMGGLDGAIILAWNHWQFPLCTHATFTIKDTFIKLVYDITLFTDTLSQIDYSTYSRVLLYQAQLWHDARCCIEHENCKGSTYRQICNISQYCSGAEATSI